jgi:hypothetical protein
MIEIDSNAKKVSDGFKKLSGTLIKTINKRGVFEALDLIKVDAKRKHRYHSRTGKLSRSLRVNKLRDGGRLLIDDALCNYAKFVHIGHKSWAPDEFLFEAYDRNEKKVDRLIDKAINYAIDRAFR